MNDHDRIPALLTGEESDDDDDGDCDDDDAFHNVERSKDKWALQAQQVRRDILCQYGCQCGDNSSDDDHAHDGSVDRVITWR